VVVWLDCGGLTRLRALLLVCRIYTHMYCLYIFAGYQVPTNLHMDDTVNLVDQ